MSEHFLKRDRQRAETRARRVMTALATAAVIPVIASFPMPLVPSGVIASGPPTNEDPADIDG